MHTDYDVDRLAAILRKELTWRDWGTLWEVSLTEYRIDGDLLGGVDDLGRNYRRPYNNPPHDLDLILRNIQGRGQLGLFLAALCYVRPDLGDLLSEYGWPPAHPPFECDPPAMVGIVAAPPAPIFVQLLSFALALIVVIGGASLLLLFRLRGSAALLFASQMALLTVAVCLTPTIAYHLTKRWGRLARVVLETTLFMALLLGFGVWLFGVSAVGIWIIYAIGLILILEAGSHLVERYKVITLKRLPRSVAFIDLKKDAEAIESMFHSELTLYIPVPVGLIVGTIVGLIRNQRPQEIVVFCLQLVLVLASLVLIYFLLVAFSRLSDPMFRTTSYPPPTVTEEKRDGFFGLLGKVWRLLAPATKSDEDQKQKSDLALACMATDLRKVYLYDAMHNVILLVAFLAVALGLWNIVIAPEWLIAILIALGLVLNQLPFVIGQSALHGKVLERYDDVERSDMAEELKKRAPLFPVLDFLAALFTTGTAGGFLYLLFEQFLKEAFK
jgi:hypothetical protein